MGMVVRSNIMALNANRQLGMNNNAVSKSLEKLSSGFKINRAGDDASGLAISEKMKAQIKGLETASANSQDGISLVQTAEGALTEVHDMLNRMVELSEKAANGTMENAVDENGNPIEGTYGNAGTDRNAIQDEMDALATEIDRIAKSTNFNGIKLLDGSLGGATVNQKPIGNAKPPVADTPTTTPSDVTPSNVNVGDASTPASFDLDIALEAGKNYNIGGKYFAFEGEAPAKAAGAEDGFTGAGTAGDPYKFTMTGKSKGDIMTAVASKLGEVTIGGSKFTAKADAAGKLTFTATEKGAAKGADGKELTKDSFEALIKESVKVEIGTDSPSKPAEPSFFSVTAVAGTKDPAKAGVATVTFDPAKIKEGSQITIGETTYTFALRGSSANTSQTGVINLTDVELNALTAKNIAEAVKTAVEKDTKFAKEYTVAASGDNLTLTEVSGKEGTADEATLKGLVSEVPAAESSYGIATADFLDMAGVMPAAAVDLTIKDAHINGAAATPTNQEAKGAGKTYTVGAGANGGGNKTLTLTYTDASGSDQEITASYVPTDSAGTNASAMKEALAKAITDGNLGELLSVELNEAGTGLTVRVSPGNTDTIKSLATDDATGSVLSSGTDAAAIAEEHSLNFADVKDGDYFTINGTKFEITADGNATTTGAVGIKAETKAEDTIKNIIAAMDKAGITATADKDTATKLIFTAKAVESPDAVKPGDTVETGKAVKLDLSEVKKAAGGNLKAGDTITIGEYTLKAASADGASAAAAGDVEFALGKDFDESMKNAVEAFNKASGGKNGTLAYDAASSSFTLSGVDKVPTIAAKVDSKTVTINATLVDAPKDKAENTYGVTELTMTQQPKAGGTVTVNGKVFEFVKKTGDTLNNENATEVVIGSDAKATLEALSKAINEDADLKSKVEASIDPNNPNKLILKNITDSAADETADDYAPEVTTEGLGGLTLQIGDTYDTFNRMDVSIGHMDMASLFTTTGDVNDPVLQKLNDGTMSLDVSTQENAGKALTAIRKAINTVSTQRAKLGAIQNRLEHTINNLDVAAENMNAANSRIRDTDMAKQMMDYTKMNVLTQAAQAMLAQANQQPQSVLQLLQ